VTAQPIAPVIPSAGRNGRRRQGQPYAARSLPLASTPGRPDAVYGFGRIDASGRVADRAVISALGWRGGDRLTVTADAGVMVARRDPGGVALHAPVADAAPHAAAQRVRAARTVRFVFRVHGGAPVQQYLHLVEGFPVDDRRVHDLFRPDPLA
jgi:hypothetical protein